VLLALLFILNWSQRDEIISEAKQKFTKGQLECDAKCKYQEGKTWVQNKLSED
jgi:hypothetical protein